MKYNLISMFRQSQTSLGRSLLVCGLIAATLHPAGAAAPPPPALTNAPGVKPPSADTNTPAAQPAAIPVAPAATKSAPAKAALAAALPNDLARDLPGDAAPAGDAASDERLRLYLQANESKSMAEWLKQQNLLEEAADIYQEALGLYRNLAEKHPGWHAELVNFRINHCEEELADLSGTRAGAPPAGLPAQFAREPSPTLGAARNTARLRRAAQLEKISDLPAALALYQEILDETPQHPAALQGAARIYLRMQRIEPARAVLRQAEQLPDSDEATLLLCALLLCHDGNFHAARRLADTLLKRNPYNANAHLVMGAVLADIGQLAAAEEATKRAITLNPKLGDAYYNLAQLSLRQQPIDLEKTRHHYRNAIKYGAAPDPALEALLD